MKKVIFLVEGFHEQLLIENLLKKYGLEKENVLKVSLRQLRRSGDEIRKIRNFMFSSHFDDKLCLIKKENGIQNLFLSFKYFYKDFLKRKHEFVFLCDENDFKREYSRRLKNQTNIDFYSWLGKIGLKKRRDLVYSKNNITLVLIRENLETYIMNKTGYNIRGKACNIKKKIISEFIKVCSNLSDYWIVELSKIIQRVRRY